MKKRKITDNIPLKIMSVAIAVVLWLIVVNIDNPTGTNYYTLNDVELINKEYVESSDTIGKMCMPEQNQDSIKVAITATKKIRDKIKVTDISAVADLQQAVSLDTNPVMVPITVTCSVPGVSPSDIKVTPQNLSVNLDEKETQEFVVNVSRGDTKPGKDYEVGSLTASPEKVRITGPKTLINKIDKVNASIDVDGATEDVTQETEVKIIDKNGEEFSDTDASYLNISKGFVTARFWIVNSDVNICAEYTGTPDSGYQVESVTTTPNVISIAGSEEALNNLKNQNNTIWISGSAVDISDQSSDFEAKLNISDYLPEGLKLTSDSSEDVFVRVNILPEGSTACEILTKNISVENQPEGMQVAFDTAKIEVRVKKSEDDLKDLDENDIKASIDLEGKEEGSYEVPVKVSIPKGYELVDEVTTGVEVSRISTADTGN